MHHFLQRTVQIHVPTQGKVLAYLPINEVKSLFSIKIHLKLTKNSNFWVSTGRISVKSIQIYFCEKSSSGSENTSFWSWRLLLSLNKMALFPLFNFGGSQKLRKWTFLNKNDEIGEFPPFLKDIYQENMNFSIFRFISSKVKISDL